MGSRVKKIALIGGETMRLSVFFHSIILLGCDPGIQETNTARSIGHIGFQAFTKVRHA